jgi:phosphate transport system substrate-binding protein
MKRSKYFEQIKIKPKTTKIGSDAIAFISNKNNNDTLVSLFVSFSKHQKVLFDNPNCARRVEELPVYSP